MDKLFIIKLSTKSTGLTSIVNLSDVFTEDFTSYPLLIGTIADFCDDKFPTILFFGLRYILLASFCKPSLFGVIVYVSIISSPYTAEPLVAIEPVTVNE